MLIGPEEMQVLDATRGRDLTQEYRSARATSEVLAARFHRLAVAVRTAFTKILAKSLIESAAATTRST